MEELDFIIEASEESMINSISFLEKELFFVGVNQCYQEILKSPHLKVKLRI